MIEFDESDESILSDMDGPEWQGCWPFTHEFPAWKYVPTHLKSVSGWKAADRKLRKGAASRGVVYVPLSRGGSVQLYALEDTVPYTPTVRTLAVRAFHAWFVSGADRQKHIRWGDAKRGWFDCCGRLRDEDAGRHVRGRDVVGVFGGERTRFRAIDLDLHGGCPDLFLERFRVLQTAFHGRDGWHYQIADENANGVHLVQVFAEPAHLDACTRELRATLETLDRRHPGLGLARLEVYPTKNHGFRLPLCRGRSMLTDRPTTDVVEYAKWLLKPGDYMPAGEVYEYLRSRLEPRTAKTAAPTHAQSTGPSVSLRGKYREGLIDFWTGKTTFNLNLALVLTARLLPYEVDEERAVEVLEGYCDELPDKSFSHRLTHNRPKVSEYIRWVVKTAYHGNGGQADPAASAAKLAAVHDAFARGGFRISDKATWTRVVVPPFRWSEAESDRIRTQVVPVLVCDEPTASESVRRFLSFVHRHRQNEIAMTAIPTILAGLKINWCQDKQGRSKKLTAFVKTLRSLGWLHIAAHHSYGVNGEKGRARRYAVGLAVASKFASGARERDCDLRLDLRSPPLGGLLSCLVGNPTEKQTAKAAFSEFNEFENGIHNTVECEERMSCAA